MTVRTPILRPRRPTTHRHAASVAGAPSIQEADVGEFAQTDLTEHVASLRAATAAYSPGGIVGDRAKVALPVGERIFMPDGSVYVVEVDGIRLLNA